MDGCLHRPAPCLLTVLSSRFLSTSPSATPSFAWFPTHLSSLSPLPFVLSSLGSSTWGQAFMVRHEPVTWNPFPPYSTSNEPSSECSPLPGSLCPLLLARQAPAYELTAEAHSLSSFLLSKHSLSSSISKKWCQFTSHHNVLSSKHTQNEPPNFTTTDSWLYIFRKHPKELSGFKIHRIQLIIEGFHCSYSNPSEIHWPISCKDLFMVLAARTWFAGAPVVNITGVLQSQWHCANKGMHHLSLGATGQQ